MTAPSDLEALLRGGPYDRETIERLKQVDPEQIREELGKYLDDEVVERILSRIRALGAKEI